MRILTLSLIAFFIPLQAFCTLASMEIIAPDGQKKSLQQIADDKKFVAIIAHGIECPVMRKNIPTYTLLHEKYSPKVAFILLNGLKGEDFATIEKETKEYKTNIPFYKDIDQQLLKALNLKVLSGVALVDLKQNQIVYSGAVDDRVNLDVAKPKAKKHYLADAINSSLGGKPVKVKQTVTYGCSISFQQH